MARFQLRTGANGSRLGCRGWGRITGSGFACCWRKTHGGCNRWSARIVDEGTLSICGRWRCLTLCQHDPWCQTNGGDGEKGGGRCHECEPGGRETRRRVSARIEYHIYPLL